MAEFVAPDHLRVRYDATTVQSRFTALDNDAPAHVLREVDPMDRARDVIALAKAFAYIG